MKTAHSLRNQCYVGILLAGGIAGTCEQSWAGQSLGFNFFLGLILLCMASFMGGFAGFFIKNLGRCLTGRPPYTGQGNEGVLLGSLLGAVLGILCGAIFASGMPTATGGALGAAIGAFLGALPDEFIGPVLELIREQESQERETASDRLPIFFDSPDR